ncbi:LssY C-terminal domain-containing protein [Arthrobacter alpinus]|uniref:LssY C-terminal domain-containing protein n=1 Tax=Arthrobacter alpinus TaxID=656366 RepID=UPI001ED9C153|nr:LssY C-terminal domain-containing protein [Arthrobacter alpinus]
MAGRNWRSRRRSFSSIVDYAAFIFGAFAALWLAYLVLSEGLFNGWYMVPFLFLFWMVLAYLVLPRLHRILTKIYVPDYFIGRARTSDGLLGDPINLAIVGSEAQLHEAMTRAGWIRADPVTLRSSWRIITSTLLKQSYDEAPVSPLLLFGHTQDLAYQKEVAGNPAKRHHVRFWRCPDGWMLPGGHRADWMAAGTFDRAVGFSIFTLQITHKIAPDTDRERDHIVHSIQEGGPDIELRVIKDFSSGYHSRNGGGDTIVTDGDLPVVDVGHLTIPPDGNPLGPDTDARRAEEANRRPTPTTLGVLLMALRFVVGIVTIGLMVKDWNTAVASTASSFNTVDQQTISALLMVVIGISAIAFLIYGLLAVLILRGSNWARIATLAFSVGFVIQAAFTLLHGENVSLSEDPLGLPLDILVLLALSARSSRLWARRPKAGSPKTEPSQKRQG